MKGWKKFDNRDGEKNKLPPRSGVQQEDAGLRPQVMCAPQWGGWVAQRPSQPEDPAVHGAEAPSQPLPAGAGGPADSGFCLNQGDFVVENGVLLRYRGQDEVVEIPRGVVRIGDGAFADHTEIVEVYLPEGVVSIGAAAFSGALMLEHVELPQSLREIGEEAFGGCVFLGGIQLPDGLVQVGDRAFQFCMSLIRIALPDGITALGNSVLAFCDWLEQVKLPAGLSSIGERAFQHCPALRELNLSPEIRSIGDRAFLECDALQLPEWVTRRFPGSVKP